MAIVQGGLIRLILKRFGDRATVTFGIAFNACAFLALALVSNGTVAMILTPMTALGAVVTPALQGMLSRRIPDDSQGELQGVLTSATSLALIISPLAMTWIFFAFTGLIAYPPVNTPVFSPVSAVRSISLRETAWAI